MHITTKAMLFSVLKIVLVSNVLYQGRGFSQINDTEDLQLYTKTDKVPTENNVSALFSPFQYSANNGAINMGMRNEPGSCNLIANGGFEDGVTLEEFEELYANLANSVEAGGVPGWYDLGGTFPVPYGSSDCFYRGSQAYNARLGIPHNT